jgi:hypothetical protein
MSEQSNPGERNKDNNILLVILLSVVWFFVVIFLAYPNLISMQNWSEILATCQKIKIHEISVDFPEKRSIIALVLSLLDYLIIMIIDLKVKPKTYYQHMVVIILMFAMFMILIFTDKNSLIWPLIVLFCSIIFIKINTLGVYFAPRSIKRS